MQELIVAVVVMVVVVVDTTVYLHEKNNSVKDMNIMEKNIQYHLLYTIPNLHHANKALTRSSRTYSLRTS